MPKKPKLARLRVWIDVDNVANIRTEIARNGRTIQGETNCILRDYYQSKWDAPTMPLPNTASRKGLVIAP